jgi:N-acetylgalactosamine-6-sulfatase
MTIQRLTIQRFTLLGLLWIAIAPLLHAQQNASRPPNIIFILTDDQGWGDAHFAGHPYLKTPNLDRLAREGTWFEQFYTAATVCSPSRAAFMTSRYPAHFHIHGHFATHEQNASRHMPDWLPTDTPNIASLLKQRGYQTAHFGKWHLGNNPGAPSPEAYGFDRSKTVNSNGPTLGDEGKEPFFRAHSTERIVNETIDFIREHREQPFYINMWTLLPHALLKPTPQQLALHTDLNPSLEVFASTPWLKDYLAKAKDLKSQMQVYAASITDLDTQVGRLLDELDRLELTNDTLIFYSSDNGPEDYRVGNASNAGVGSAGILRARKRSMYEGGIRTFGLVRWPGKVKANHRNTTQVIAAVDFLPTLCALTDTPLPDSLKLDGEDMSRAWLGEEIPRRKPLHWEWLFNVQGDADGYMPPTLAVRDQQWKLFVHHDGSKPELYDIVKDPSEQHNIASQHPEITQQLSATALAWSRSLPASELRANPQRNVKRNTPAQASNPTKINRAAIFARWDTNQDQQLNPDEYRVGVKASDHEQRFKNFDKDRSGQLSVDEFVYPNGKPQSPKP